MVLEERVSRLEGAYEQVDRRLDDLNQNITSLREEMRVEFSGLRTDMNRGIGGPRTEVSCEISRLRSDLNSGFNNLYVLLGGLWATVVAGFVGVGVAIFAAV